MRTILCLLTVCCFSVGFAEEAANPAVTLPDKAHFRLVLLTGQSNMAGRGKVEAQDLVVHPRVVMLSANGVWVPAIDPVHYDKAGAGVGLGRTFAIALAEKDPSITVGLIPTACGGSPISTWVPGGYHNQTKSHPYDDCLARARLALTKGTLTAILWHQGESDSGKSSDVYQEKLKALFVRMRSDLGAPEVPILVGQLGQFEGKDWSDSTKQVDAAHRAMVDLLPKVGFVSSDRLTSNPDKVHFNAESQREFGRRYAEAYFKLVAPPTR